MLLVAGARWAVAFIASTLRIRQEARRKASKRRSMLRPRRRRRWMRLVALGVAVLLGLLYYRPVRTYVNTRHTLNERTTEVQALAARKHQFEVRLAQIEQGSSLVRGARRLGLVKPGEHLFIVQGIQQWRRAHAKSK